MQQRYINALSNHTAYCCMNDPGTGTAFRRERSNHWRVAGIAFVFLWFFIGGIAHFVLTETEMRIVPPWISWPREAVLISGVFELLGAAGLLSWRTRRAAGWGLIALTLAVTPAHIYMLQQPQLFGVPYWALLLRLPIQVALLWLIWWSTKRCMSPRTPKLSSRT